MVSLEGTATPGLLGQSMRVCVCVGVALARSAFGAVRLRRTSAPPLPCVCVCECVCEPDSLLGGEASGFPIHGLRESVPIGLPASSGAPSAAGVHVHLRMYTSECPPSTITQLNQYATSVGNALCNVGNVLCNINVLCNVGDVRLLCKVAAQRRQAECRPCTHLRCC